jgi:flagellin
MEVIGMSNLTVATNIAGINAHRSLKLIAERGRKASEKLSSGYRINRAADDAAGLAISEKMRNQIHGLNQAQRNVEAGINVCMIMDGGMAEIGEIITRKRELTIQAMNDTNVCSDREKIQIEIDQLTAEIGAIAEKTQFNTIPLLNISSEIVTSGGGTFEIGGYGSVTPAAGITASNLGTNHVDLAGLAQPGITQVGVINLNDGAIVKVQNLGINTTWVTLQLVQQPGGTPIDITGGSFGGMEVTGPGVWSIQLSNTGPIPSGIFACLRFSGVSGNISGGHSSLGYSPLYIKSGANANQGMLLNRYNCRPEALGICHIKVCTVANAEESLESLDRAIDTISTNRAKAGAQQNRLEHIPYKGCRHGQGNDGVYKDKYLVTGGNCYASTGKSASSIRLAAFTIGGCM